MLGKNLKKIRESLHISQRELGRRIGKTGQYISYLENTEDSNPSLDVLNKITDALKISLSDLIPNTEQSFSYNLILTIERLIHENTGHGKNYMLNEIEYMLSQDDIDTEPIYELVKNKTFELPVEIQLRLLQYLFELDYNTFFQFCENNKLSIVNNSTLNDFINKCYGVEINQIQTTSYLAFKKYLFITFGDKINEFITEDNIRDLREETEKFLEFALFKIEKEYYGENQED